MRNHALWGQIFFIVLTLTVGCEGDKKTIAAPPTETPSNPAAENGSTGAALVTFWSQLDAFDAALRGGQTEGVVESQGERLEWRAQVSPLRLDLDQKNRYIAELSAMLQDAPSPEVLGPGTMVSMIASMLPPFIEDMGAPLRCVRLEFSLGDDAAPSLVAPCYYLWFDAQTQDTVGVVRHEVKGDSPRTSPELLAHLNARSGVNILRAMLFFEQALRDDPIMGRMIAKSGMRLWPWAGAFFEIMTTGALRFGEGETPLPLPTVFKASMGLAQLEGGLRMLVPLRGSVEGRLDACSATAAQWEALFCANLVEGASCDDAAIRQQLVALSIALEGFNAFFSDLGGMLSFYIAGNPEVIPGVTLRGTVVSFRNVGELRLVIKAFASSPFEASRFATYAASRGEEGLFDVLSPSTTELLNIRGLYDGVQTRAVESVQAQIEGTHGDVTVLIDVTMRLAAGDDPGKR